MDLNDAPFEPQIVLGSTDSQAANGYFVYRVSTLRTPAPMSPCGFSTTVLPGPARHRVIIPSRRNGIMSPSPKSVNFAAPQPSGSTATLRPLVRITSPANGSFVYVPGATLAITADATDLDGIYHERPILRRHQQSRGKSFQPLDRPLDQFGRRSHVLTAIAVDNTGATTLSAPVLVSLTFHPSLRR